MPHDEACQVSIPPEQDKDQHDSLEELNQTLSHHADQRGGGIPRASSGFEDRQYAAENQPAAYTSQEQSPAVVPGTQTPPVPAASRGPAFNAESRAPSFMPESTAPPPVTERGPQFLPENRPERAASFEPTAPAVEPVRRPREQHMVLEPHRERSSPSTSDRSSQPSPQSSSSRTRPDLQPAIPEQPAVVGQQQGPAARQGSGQAPLTNGRPHGAAVAGHEKSDGELFSRELTAVAALEVRLGWLLANQIYTIGSQVDGSVSIDKRTVMPSMALCATMP